MDAPVLSHLEVDSLPDPSCPAEESSPLGTISIPFQPHPILTRVVHFKLFREWITAIMRHWNPGDAVRCKLCPTCKAYQDGCLTVVTGRVEHGDAGMLSIHRMQIDEGV